MTTGRDEIRDWLRERISDVEQDGGLSLVGCSHFNAAGAEVPIDVLSAKAAGTWGDPEKMADRLYSIARRHCGGLTGSQQLQLSAVYGSTGRPSRYLPFLIAGASHISGPNGLSTEPPTMTGAMSQGMRLTEIHAQGNFAMTASLMTAAGQMISQLMTREQNIMKLADDRGAALSNVLTLWQQQQMSREIRALVIDGARKLLPLLPALAGTTTGLDVPQDVAEASFFDAMVEAYSPQQLQAYVSTLAAPANGVAADMLVKAQRRKAARDAERAREVSYDQASADAAGEAFAALRGRPQTTASNGHSPDVGARILDRLGTNGHANGHGKVEPPNAETMDDATILTTMLESLTDTEVDQVAAIYAGKRPDVPGLKDEIKKRYAAVRARQNAG